ncbi:MAG: exo-alpha-sialidase [Bryobacteraceae bacterium]
MTSLLASRAFSIAVLLAVPLTAGDLVQTDVFVSGKDGYDTYRIPSVIVTKKKTVLAFCEGRRNSKSDTGDIDMLVKRSADGGRTWSPQQVIWDDGPNTCGNPTPVVDQATGVIWLLLTHNLGQDTEQQIGRRTSKGTRTVWVTRSEDDGVHWTRPVEITGATKKPEWGWYATGPGVGIQLESGPHKGRLLIPSNHSVQPDPGRPDVFRYGDHVIYSDDHGAHWKVGGVIPWLDVDEPQAVELADGGILMNMRSGKAVRRRITGLSRDGGESFSARRVDESLIEPPCQASLLRYTRKPKNRLLFSNPADREQRIRMTVKLSYDEGATWPVSRELHSGPSAYSVLAVLPGMRIACIYERGHRQPYETITFAQFPLEWLSKGTDRLEPPPTAGKR